MTCAPISFHSRANSATRAGAVVREGHVALPGVFAEDSHSAVAYIGVSANVAVVCIAELAQALRDVLRPGAHQQNGVDVSAFKGGDQVPHGLAGLQAAVFLDAAHAEQDRQAGLGAGIDGLNALVDAGQELRKQRVDASVGQQSSVLGVLVTESGGAHLYDVPTRLRSM